MFTLGKKKFIIFLNKKLTMLNKIINLNEINKVSPKKKKVNNQQKLVHQMNEKITKN